VAALDLDSLHVEPPTEIVKMSQFTKFASLVVLSSSTALAAVGCTAEAAEPNNTEGEATTQIDESQASAQMDETSTTDETTASDEANAADPADPSDKETDDDATNASDEENVGENASAIGWGWGGFGVRPWGFGGFGFRPWGFGGFTPVVPWSGFGLGCGWGC
jgi:hypothetical protein